MRNWLFGGAVLLALMSTPALAQVGTPVLPKCVITSSAPSGLPANTTYSLNCGPDNSLRTNDVAAGSQADSAWSGTGSGSLVALLKGIYSQLSSLGTTASSPLPLRAASAQPTAVTDGQTVQGMADLLGKAIGKPFSPSGLDVKGTTTGTDASAHTIIASAGTGLKNYITGLQCARTDAGTTPIVLTFNDSASTVMVLLNGGNGGANNFVLQTPLATAAATAFTFTSGTSTTTVYCNAQGYAAP